MSDDEYRKHRKESFNRWYYSENHGKDKAAKKRERRYQEVLARHGNVCYLCRVPVVREDTHLDHVVPRSSGGPDSYDNLRITHWECNLAKGHNRWVGPVWVGYLTRIKEWHFR